ncbi:hypothetical protein FQZ97_637740 [compost metagenome]
MFRLALDAGQQPVGHHALFVGAGLVAGLQHLPLERRERVGGEEQGHLGAGFQGDGIGHRQLDQHRRLRGVGHLEDALAGHHRFAQPVVGVAEHRHAGARRAYAGALQLGLYRRQFRAALLGPAVQQGQLALALGVVEGALAGGHQLGVSHRHFLAEHFGAALQGGFVEGEEQRAFFHRLVRADLHAFDHAVDGGADDLGLARDGFRRRQGGLPHRYQHQRRGYRQRGQDLALAGAPAEEAAPANEGGPAVGPGLPDPLHQRCQVFRRRRIQQEQHQPQALAVPVMQGDAPEPGGPPFGPTFGDIAGWLQRFTGQPAWLGVGQLGAQPAARAP